MVILKLYSAETFPFQKGTCQAPVRCVPSTFPSKPMIELHAVKYPEFEGHLYAVSFNPHQSAITTWRTPTRLPSVWRFGAPEWTHVYQLLSLVCGTCPLSAQCCTCPLSAQCCTYLSQLYRDLWLTISTKPRYNNNFRLWCLNHGTCRMKSRFKNTLLHIEQLCDKTSTQIRRRHVCEDNIKDDVWETWGVSWIALDSRPLKAVQTLCSVCPGNVATRVFNDDFTVNVVMYGGNILQ
jgi:hypothetical protein